MTFVVLLLLGSIGCSSTRVSNARVSSARVSSFDEGGYLAESAWRAAVSRF